MKLREIIQEAIKEANVINEKGWYIAGWFDVQGFVWGLDEEGKEGWVGPANGDTYLIYANKEEALTKAEEAAETPVGFDGGNNKVKWVYASGKVVDVDKEPDDESDEEDILVQQYEGPYDNPPEKTKWIGLKGANVGVKIKEEVNQDNLKEEIELYKKNSAEVAEMQKSIEDVLKKVKEKTSQENSRLKAIINFMKNFDLKKVEADKWVAELEESPAFTSPAISYKDMYEKALTKVNAATLTVIKKLEAEHLLGKAAMKKTDLKITDKPINEGVGGFVNWLKGLIPAVKNYNKVVDELPEIKNEEQIRHGAAIMGHSLPKDIRYKDAKNVVNK